MFCVWHRFCDCDFCEYLYASLPPPPPPPLSLHPFNSLPTDFYYHPVLLFNYLCFVTYVIGFHLLRLLSAPLFCTYSLCVYIITWLCTPPSRVYMYMRYACTCVYCRCASSLSLFLSLKRRRETGRGWVRRNRERILSSSERSLISQRW